MFDVTALYQLIDLELGLNSLRWFLNTFCYEYQDKTLQDLIYDSRLFCSDPLLYNMS